MAEADLDYGTVHSLLKPGDIDGRAVDGTEIWVSRAKVALAIELLLRSGMKDRIRREHHILLFRHAPRWR
jgi:hypothetical protein